jgi:hemerythrin-like domain-containing protein
MDAIEMLMEQHEQVDDLFEKISNAGGSKDKWSTFLTLADMLAVHAAIEERHFYPAVRAKQTEEILLESVEEHLAVKRVLADLLRADVEDPSFDAKIKLLQELVQHHVEEEQDELFPKVKKLLDADQLEAIAQEMTATMVELADTEPRNDVPSQTDHPASLH